MEHEVEGALFRIQWSPELVPGFNAMDSGKQARVAAQYIRPTNLERGFLAAAMNAGVLPFGASKGTVRKNVAENRQFRFSLTDQWTGHSTASKADAPLYTPLQKHVLELERMARIANEQALQQARADAAAAAAAHRELQGPGASSADSVLAPEPAGMPAKKFSKSDLLAPYPLGAEPMQEDEASATAFLQLEKSKS